jgi:hypothetical protein
MEITGGNTTLTADIDDIKARATTAFSESMKKVGLFFSVRQQCVITIVISNNFRRE